MLGRFFRRIQRLRCVTIACPMNVVMDTVSGKRLHVERGQWAKCVAAWVPICMLQTGRVARAVDCAMKRGSIWLLIGLGGIGEAAL